MIDCQKTNRSNIIVKTQMKNVFLCIQLMINQVTGGLIVQFDELGSIFMKLFFCLYMYDIWLTMKTQMLARQGIYF